jgi:lysophospholipase L1-like esterase
MNRSFVRSLRGVLGLLLAAGAGSFSRAEPLVHAGDRLAICGDSITEQKRYSVMVETYLLACQPAAARPADVAQFGWGGERIGGLLARLGTDLPWFRPTVATLCYGMNDGSYLAPSAAAEQLFREKLSATVQQLKQAGVTRLVVGTPGAVDTTNFRRPGTTADSYNETLARFGAIAREVAAAEHVAFADLHGPMLAVMKQAKAKYGSAYHLAGLDGVHPFRNGHLVMAGAFLKALGCDGAIGTVTWDVARGEAQASGGHTVIAVRERELTLESTRYPFCFSGDPAAPDSTRGVLAFFPFNEELNRFLLVVTGLPGGRVRLTWGGAAREFSAAELAHGINLAAEFPDNPFSAAFATVEQAVAGQQMVETPLVKEIVHDATALRTAAPRSFPGLLEEMLKTRQQRFDAAGESVKPVRHSLRIEFL